MPTAQSSLPIHHLQENNFMSNSLPQPKMINDSYWPNSKQNSHQYNNSKGAISHVSSANSTRKTKVRIPFSQRTQKARRIEQELKIVEVSKKKRKISKKEITSMLDRTVKWKKKKEARIHEQKVKQELSEQQQCTFNPDINSVSQTLCQKSNGRLCAELQSPRAAIDNLLTAKLPQELANFQMKPYRPTHSSKSKSRYMPEYQFEGQENISCSFEEYRNHSSSQETGSISI